MKQEKGQEFYPVVPNHSVKLQQPINTHGLVFPEELVYVTQVLFIGQVVCPSFFEDVIAIPLAFSHRFLLGEW